MADTTISKVTLTPSFELTTEHRPALTASRFLFNRQAGGEAYGPGRHCSMLSILANPAGKLSQSHVWPKQKASHLMSADLLTNLLILGSEPSTGLGESGASGGSMARKGVEFSNAAGLEIGLRYQRPALSASIGKGNFSLRCSGACHGKTSAILKGEAGIARKTKDIFI